MIQAMLGPKKGDNLFLHRNQPQWTPGKPQNQRYQQDPDAMDVNATTMGNEKKDGGQQRRLSPEEKQRCLKEGRCFICGCLGHMSQVCPKKKEGGNGQERSEKARVATVEEDQQEEKKEESKDTPGNPPPYDPATMMSHICAMTTKERDRFLDNLMMAEKDF